MRTRFAPSPTGELHLGHVLSAAYTWAWAQYYSAEIVLRFENHDAERSKTLFKHSISADLAWLGLSWDNEACHFPSPLTQCSPDRQKRYAELLTRLHEQGDAYVCTCSNKALRERRMRKTEQTSAHKNNPKHKNSSPHKNDSRVGRGRGNNVDQTGAYDGFCRQRGLPRSQDSVLRLQSNNPSTDIRLNDARGLYSYAFCNVIDDQDQGVDLIVRGEDILPFTQAQRELRSALFGPRAIEPIYKHHSLLMEVCGTKKLSKRRGSQTIAERRQNTGLKPIDIWLEAFGQHFGSEAVIKRDLRDILQRGISHVPEALLECLRL